MATELAHFIQKHAQDNYEAGGWDIIIECWTLDEIDEHLNKHAAASEAEAIAAFIPLIDVWADRQADADFHQREALGDIFAPEGWTEIEGGHEHER